MTPDEGDEDEEAKKPMQGGVRRPHAYCSAVVQFVATVVGDAVWAWVQYLGTTIKWGDGPNDPNMKEWDSGWGYDSEGGYDAGGNQAPGGIYGPGGAGEGVKNPNHPYYGPQAHVGGKIGMRDTPGWGSMPTGPHGSKAGAKATQMAFAKEIKDRYGVDIGSAPWVQIKQEFKTYLVDTTHHKVILGYEWSLTITMDADGVSAELSPPKKSTY